MFRFSISVDYFVSAVEIHLQNAKAFLDRNNGSKNNWKSLFSPGFVDRQLRTQTNPIYRN